jgi:hypothetical protein
MRMKQTRHVLRETDEKSLQYVFRLENLKGKSNQEGGWDGNVGVGHK